MTASKRQVGGGHYRNFAIQPSEFIHRNGLGWCEGNAIKYVSRHKSKNGRQDILKAIHYLELLLEWEYPDAPPADPPVMRRIEPDSVSGHCLPIVPCASCEDD